MGVVLVAFRIFLKHSNNLKNKNNNIFIMHYLWPSEINLFSDNLLKDYRD